MVLDIATGRELARAEVGMGIQSALFPASGFDRDFYVCSLMGIARVAVRSEHSPNTKDAVTPGLVAGASLVRLGL